MTMPREIDLDQVLGSWLEDAAGSHPVDYLDEVLEQTRRTEQRPAWSFPGRWLPFQGVLRPIVVAPSLWLLVLLAMLVVLVAALLVAGSMRHLPAPNGLARPGLVALDADGHTAVMNADGSGRRLLTAGDTAAAADTSPVWSPDGTRLAFWRTTAGGNWAVVVARAEGTVVANVAVHTTPGLNSLGGYAMGAPSFLAWSPDSSHLVFSLYTGQLPGVWVLGSDGTGLAQLGDPALPASDPSWSGDGTRIVFHGGSCGSGASGGSGGVCGDNGENGVYVMNADGSNAHRVSRVNATGYDCSTPQWQPGGELIAFNASPAGHMHIFVVRSDGTGEADISSVSAEAGTDDWIPRWSPDGTRIAFERVTEPRTSGQIAVANPDGSGAVIPGGQPAAGTGGPMWSPDGRTISSLADDGSGGSSGILILDLEGTNPPIVVPATGNSGGTSWQRLAP